MLVHDMEKKAPAVAETPRGVSSGDATPISSSGDVVMSDADKKLEAMGYAPVTIAPPCISPERRIMMLTLLGLQTRVLRLVQLQFRHEHRWNLRLPHVNMDLRTAGRRRCCHHVELDNRGRRRLGVGHESR